MNTSFDSLVARYMSLDGRLARAQYWIRLLPLCVPGILLEIVARVMPRIDSVLVTALLVLLSVVSSLSIWPMSCLAARRLHDRNRSGAWVLVQVAAALVGGFALMIAGRLGGAESSSGLVLLLLAAACGAVVLWLAVEIGFIRGTSGPNSFGPDPLAGGRVVDGSANLKVIAGLCMHAALLLLMSSMLFANTAIRSARLDMTESRLYTLSAGTKNLLGKLEEPIKLRLYFSKKLAADAAPALSAYASRVQELLEQYVSRSHGKIALEVLDPEPFSEEEDRAVGYGLQGVPATVSGEMLYFGLAGTNSTDQEEVIAFIQESKEESLEYDVTKLVYNLSNPRKKVVGLLTKLPMEGNPMARMMNPAAESNPWFVVDAIRQLFDVRSVSPGAESIDADIDVLMVVHPQSLSPATLYAIDQYVLRGGKALVFVDPQCESQDVPRDPQNPMAAMMANRSSDLGPLLAAWGVEMSNEDVAGDRENALKVNSGNNVPVDYILYIALDDPSGSFAEEDFVTAKLNSVTIATAGVLKKKDGGTTAVTPLFKTSATAMRVSRSSVMFGPDPAKLLADFVPGSEPLTLAARVSGPAKTAFPDGKPKADPVDGEPPPEETPAESLKESAQINLIVVADADMLQDHFWTRVQNFFGQRVAMPTANNADFVINALDNLSGSNDLISLRSRGKFNRPFDKVAEIRREAETRFRQEEKRLEAKLKDTEQKITELQAQKDTPSALILSPEQQTAIEGFREEKVKTRKELRRVKHELQKDIDRLGTVLKLVNIVLIPVLLIIAAVGLALARSKRAAAAASHVGPRT